jgi:pimeloyl-ACP methyl ester carboxylesterase
MSHALHLPFPERLEWPSCQRAVELSSGTTRFVDAGEGPPLVLIHGLMGYSFCWRKNIPALAKQFRVLALDLAGCGYSDPLRSGGYSTPAWSGQVEEFLDALALPKAHLLGTSAGGTIAVDLAVRRPERVETLVLAAPVNPCSRRVVFLSRLYRASGLPAPLVRFLVDHAARWMPGLFRRRYYADSSRLTPETIPGYLQGLRVEITVRMLRESIRAWQPSRMDAQLRQVTTPTLLVWGDKDKLVPAACIRHLRKALPNAALAMIRGTGHFCHEELPEAFHEAVIQFLRSGPPVR